MRIFICGFSRSGKTHLAQLLSESLGLKYTSASGWLKRIDEVRAEKATDETKQEYIERLTEMSMDILAQDPDVCIDWIGKKIDIVEGIRNPRDFAHLFDAGEDVLIWCRREDVSEAATDFERIGLSGIESYMAFQKLIHPDLKMIEVTHKGPPDGLELQLESILEQLGAKKVWKLK